MKLAVFVFALATLVPACHGDTKYIGTDCLATGTGADLQAAIDARKTVLLCPRAEIVLSQLLVLRQGLTLFTAGLPSDPTEMATIRLGADFPISSSGAVRGSGSDIHLASVRFDGNRRVLGTQDSQALVEIGPGDGYSIVGCSFTDAPGWTHLHLIEPCDSSIVTDNVVESASRPHDAGGHWTDGVSIACSHTTIARNQIHDPSAVGIVYYGGAGTTISDNVVTLEKTSAFSGINVGDAIVADHTGVVVSGNRVTATSPRYLGTGLTAGLHVIGKTTTISGVTLRDNVFEGMARWGLAVDGCLDCTIAGNDASGWHPLPALAKCPAPSAYDAAVTVGHASGTIQPGYVDAKLDGCPGDPEPLGAVYRSYAGDGQLFPEYLAFEVKTYSERVEQKLDAAGLLKMEWDAIAARAKTLCPMGTATDLQLVWRTIVAAQLGDGLAPADADAKAHAALMAAPSPAPSCAP
ncbi:MAG TPA: right-handed parallel beta-helix repeat-containing protein [Polyangia bacterium]|nr:right-handed parallel beta-helix repeat-containing protein [Polyangia bacterium]